MAKINYKGTGQVEAILKSVEQKWLKDVAMDLTGEAQRLAPKDTGALRASGYWEVKNETAKIIFDTPYAAVQHERIDFNHQDGEAKYLEKPFKAKQATYAASLAARLRGRIGS